MDRSHFPRGDRPGLTRQGRPPKLVEVIRRRGGAKGACAAAIARATTGAVPGRACDRPRRNALDHATLTDRPSSLARKPGGTARAAATPRGVASSPLATPAPVAVEPAPVEPVLRSSPHRAAAPRFDLSPRPAPCRRPVWSCAAAQNAVARPGTVTTRLSARRGAYPSSPAGPQGVFWNWFPPRPQTGRRASIIADIDASSTSTGPICRVSSPASAGGAMPRHGATYPIWWPRSRALGVATGPPRACAAASPRCAGGPPAPAATCS